MSYTLQSRYCDIMQKCLWGVCKWGAETTHGSEWRVKYSSALLLAAGTCICNFNINNLCHRKTLQRCQIKMWDLVEMLMLVCLVVLYVWAHRCVLVTAEELNQRNGCFWNSGFVGSWFPLHTPSPPHCPLLYKGINSSTILEVGVEGLQGLYGQMDNFSPLPSGT